MQTAVDRLFLTSRFWKATQAGYVIVYAWHPVVSGVPFHHMLLSLQISVFFFSVVMKRRWYFHIHQGGLLLPMFPSAEGGKKEVPQSTFVVLLMPEMLLQSSLLCSFLTWLQCPLAAMPPSWSVCFWGTPAGCCCLGLQVSMCLSSVESFQSNLFRQNSMECQILSVSHYQT